MFKYLLTAILLSSTAYADEVVFSPHRGATQEVVNFITSAKQSVHVAAYSFTSYPISEALIAASNRGVNVEVVLDKSNDHAPHSTAKYLDIALIPVRIDHKYAIMHDKFIVVDGVRVETGSFNYTKSAEERNAENVLVLDNPNIASKYTTEWQRLWDESQPYRK